MALLLVFMNIWVGSLIITATCDNVLPHNPQCSESPTKGTSFLQQQSVRTFALQFATSNLQESEQEGHADDLAKPKKKRAKQCLSWCHGKPQSWSKKCKWRKCGACFSCNSGCNSVTCMGNGECVSYAARESANAMLVGRVSGAIFLTCCLCQRPRQVLPLPIQIGFSLWVAASSKKATFGELLLAQRGTRRALPYLAKILTYLVLNPHLVLGGPFKVRGPEPVSSGDKSGTWVKSGEPLAPRGFRVDMKKTSDGTLLYVSSGYASHLDEKKRGFGFTITFSKNGMDGPWEEICVYNKGRASVGEDHWTWLASSPKAPSMNYRADASNDNHARRFDCEMSDPTFVELEDGSAIIGYRGTQCAWDYKGGDHFQEVPALLVADHWSGPYTRLGVKVLGDHADAEDMYMWRNPRGVHMLCHHMGKEYGDLYKKLRGGYAFTPDKTGLTS